MPSAGEVAALGLASAEDSLSSSTPTAEFAKDSRSLSTDLLPAARTAVSGSSAAPGFSLGHGFPFIPSKIVSKIQKWEFINLSELFPDNLELARRTSRVCPPVRQPQEARAPQGLERPNRLVRVF